MARTKTTQAQGDVIFSYAKAFAYAMQLELRVLATNTVTGQYKLCAPNGAICWIHMRKLRTMKLFADWNQK